MKCDDRLRTVMSGIAVTTPESPAFPSALSRQPIGRRATSSMSSISRVLRWMRMLRPTRPPSGGLPSAHSGLRRLLPVSFIPWSVRPVGIHVTSIPGGIRTGPGCPVARRTHTCRPTRWDPPDMSRGVARGVKGALPFYLEGQKNPLGQSARLRPCRARDGFLGPKAQPVAFQATGCRCHVCHRGKRIQECRWCLRCCGWCGICRKFVETGGRPRR